MYIELTNLRVYLTSRCIFMYNTNLNVEAIRTIDNIIQTPKSTYRSLNSEINYSERNFDFQDKGTYSDEQVVKIVEEASKALEVVNTELTFRVHEGTGRPVIQLVELVSKEVIREIPPERMLDILAGIWEWAGLIVDRKE